MARDQTVSAELALAADGRFLGLRWTALYNMGAYIEGAGCVPVVFSLRLGQTAYAIPAVSVSNGAIFTHTAPTVPYRGAGRPEAVYIMERLIDQAAREMEIDRVDLRRRNLIASDAMPYTTATGWTYDCGDFAATLDQCMAAADWDGFAARRSRSETAGLLRGRGIGYYIDNTGLFNDRMEIRFDPSGTVSILSGVFSHGQGHDTSFKQMVAEWLSVAAEDITLVQGDTDAVAVGRGTYGSRSMMVGGSALRRAADAVIENGKRFAGHFMEADVADIMFADGAFQVEGTDRSMTITEVAQMSFMPMGLPDDAGIGLHGAGHFSADSPSFPNGCHICEVEIDPETGALTLDRYVVVDDIGTVINPLTAAGQVHGGVVQGIGQALMEAVTYDRDDGQLITGSLLDYTLPRAGDVPDIQVAFNSVPSASNPLGVKGVGEGGTVGATPTVINGILDALAPLGVADIAMPATPDRIWSAIRNAADNI